MPGGVVKWRIKCQQWKKGTYRLSGRSVKSQRAKFLVGLILAFLLLAFFFRGIDWRGLGQALGGARPLPLVGLVLVTLAAYVVRAWRWGGLLAPLGRVRLADLFSATMVGFASSLIVPRSGELLRPWLISRRHSIPTSAGFATIVIERLIDLITVLVLFALCLFVLPRPAMQIESPLMDMLKLAGAIAGVAALGLLAFLLALHANARPIVGGLERVLAGAPNWISKPFGRILRSFSDGLAVLRAPAPQLARIILQSLAVWLLTALGFHLNHIALSIDLPFHITFLLVAFLAVGEAIPTPGLVGGFHAFYLLALSEVYGIDRTTAAAAGIAAHALTTIPVLVVGFALLGREGLSLGRAVEAARDERGLRDRRSS